MHRIRIAAAVVALAGLLAACDATVFVAPDYDKDATAQVFTGANLNDAAAADVETLGPFESIRYRVAFDSSAYDAVYYRLEEDLEITVRDRFGTAIASSSDEDFFLRGTLAVGATEAAVAPSGIATALACGGPCVIERYTGSTRYVDVTNPTGGSVTFGFYPLQRDFEDDNEGRSSPAALGTGTTRGALETLDDVDRYQVQSSGSLSLSGNSASGLDYVAEVRAPGGPYFIDAGDSLVVNAGEEVLVYAENGGTRAAAAGKSLYFLELD
jgi:hypothetical protein